MKQRASSSTLQAVCTEDQADKLHIDTLSCIEMNPMVIATKRDVAMSFTSNLTHPAPEGYTRTRSRRSGHKGLDRNGVQQKSCQAAGYVDSPRSEQSTSIRIGCDNNTDAGTINTSTTEATEQVATRVEQELVSSLVENMLRSPVIAEPNESPRRFKYKRPRDAHQKRTKTPKTANSNAEQPIVYV